MKKATDASPNQALKHERTLRCWSQLEVADRIGTTAFNVSRWERGITFPGSYFRQQLCLLFEKSPQELGFLKAAEQKELRQGSDPDPIGQLQVSPSAVEESREPGPEQERLPDSSEKTVQASNETLPLIWNVPYRRNPFFTGRAETLHALHAALHTGDLTVRQAVAISGLGGIGKTQVALEYVYRYSHTYQAVFWARADARELLVTDFAHMATLLALPEHSDQDQGRAVAAVKRWLSRSGNWLLILDNADDLAMIAPFLPEILGGHLLLTTRTRSTGQIAQPMAMQTLDMEEGMLLLLRRAKLLAGAEPLDHSPAAQRFRARTIAEIMGGLPLALDQAAAYIEETGCGLNGYIQRYQQRSLALLLRRGNVSPDHPESLAATWSLSFEKIALKHPPAIELLQVCAFLQPDAIPEEMLTSGISKLTPSLRLLARDPFAMDEALEVLITFSLIHRDAETHMLSLHRLVQVVLREQMDEQTQRLWAERTVQVVEQAFLSVSFTTWQNSQECLPHALVCGELIEQFHLTSPAALSLLNKAGSYLRERGHYREAGRLLTTALALSEETQAENAPLLAQSLNNLGLLAHDQGKYTRSESLLQRALTLYEQLWGPDHLMVAQCLSNQAENYRVQVRQSEMEELVRRALAIRERELGASHPDVARSLNQLANLYHSQCKYSLAEPLYQRALEILRRTLGAEHIDVAQNLNNLASLYESLGKYALAKPLYQQALSFCENHLGEYHAHTATALLNLAEVYRVQGGYEQAEQLHRRALAIREQTLGADHHHVARSLNALAEISLACKRYHESEDLISRALVIWEKTLGQRHHYTAIGLDTLARLRNAQGQPAEAGELASRALAIFQDVWGDNEDTANSLNTQAEIFCTQEAYAQAGPLLQQALQIQEQLLDPEHPQTARSLNNLAALCTAQGNLKQATDYCERALAIRRRALPPEHPDLVATEQQYAHLLRQNEDKTSLLR